MIMKTTALCFFILASALPLFAQVPLTGYDIFEVTTDASVPSTAFEFKSALTGKSLRGMRALTPILTARDAAKLDLACRELGGAPIDGVSVLFRPGAKDKLLVLAARKQPAEVMISINGKACATFKVDELIQLIEKRVRFFVVFHYTYTDPFSSDEYLNMEAMVKQIKNGQWTKPVRLDVPMKSN